MFFLFSFLFNKISFIICSIPKKPFFSFKFFSTKKEKKKREKEKEKGKRQEKKKKKNIKIQRKKKLIGLLLARAALFFSTSLFFVLNGVENFQK